jgi:ABC-type multidrug transport system ATPase subunit
MPQRAGRALMSAPRILVLDEPTLGLSPFIMQEVLTVIRQLRDQGITIVLVEQNVHNALSVANRAYVLTTGRIVAKDTAAGPLKNPDRLRAYISAAKAAMTTRMAKGRFWRQKRKSKGLIAKLRLLSTAVPLDNMN